MYIVKLAVIFIASLLVSIPSCQPNPSDFDLTKADNGRTIQTVVNGKITVTLDSNATTGYQWEIQDLNQTILSNTDHTYQALGNLIGSGGQEIWEFTAVATGSTTLKMRYVRPFDPPETEPADTFQIEVTVTEGNESSGAAI